MDKLKFTFIDALIVLVVIVGVVVGVISLKPEEKTEVNGKAEITVLVQDTERGTDKLINVNDKIQIGNGEKVVDATVELVEETAKREYKFNRYIEKFVLKEDESKADVKVKVSCEAQITDTKITCGDFDVRVGNEMTLQGKGFNIKGYVVELEDIQEED